MGYVLAASLVVLGGLAAFQILSRLRASTRSALLRWGAGGGAILLTLVFAVVRRFDLAFFSAAAAYSVLRHGRLGSLTLGGGAPGSANISKVRSRFFEMELDHDSGTVIGRVIAGQFARANLIDLGEMETRALIEEIAGDPDSESLLESWLDANRAGWREYFAETERESPAGSASLDREAEALAVLGLQPGAGIEDIRAAHHRLMKNFHPDHGGSSFLAAKINEARDHLLEIANRRR